MNEANVFIYPVITLYQPWATWIMLGWKIIETRTHNRFQSLLHKNVLIHAGQQTDLSAWDNNPYLTEEQLQERTLIRPNGAILGSAYVDACGWLCGDDFENKSALIETTNRYGLFLKNISPFDKPIPCKGEMGIWYYDLYNKRKVKKFTNGN